MPEFYIRHQQLDTFFRTEALEKPAEVFRKVHTPIDQIAVDFYKEGPYERFVSEDQVARWVLNSSGTLWGNRIFTITGETGSGKSELCQAIRYQAEETKGHVPILISRSMTRLRDIVSLLHQHLDEPQPDDIGEITALPAETVRSAAVTECLLTVETKAFQAYTPEQRQKLRQILQDVAFGRLIERAFTRYKKEVVAQGKERVLELMDYDEFQNLMSGAAPFLKAAEVFPLFRSRVNDGMKRLVSLGDLSQRLRSIAQHYQKQSKRPVLIMEDLTSFGFVKEDLLDYLFDLNGGNFDVVIGWTTGFEAEQLLRNPNEGVRSYMMDRMKGRFLTTSQDTRGSFFLERNHLPMVARYLDAVREPAAADRIPDPFYPLNPYAVTRIYQQLIDDKGQQKRTPRLLIDVIGRILRSNVPPWEEIEARLLRVNLQDWPLPDSFFTLKQEYPAAVALLKWYGRPDDHKVDRRTVELLGVAWPPALAQYLSDESIWSERSDEPVGQDQPTKEEGEHGAGVAGQVAPSKQASGLTPDNAGGSKTTTGTTATVRTEPTQPKPQVDQDLLELQNWVAGSDTFPGRQKLKAGLTYLLNLTEDHATIANPRGQLSVLKYEKSTLPIVMAGTNDSDVDHPAIRLQPTREHYEFYRICLAITSAREAEASLSENLRLAAWVGSLVREYQQSQRVYLSTRLGLPIEAAIFHAYRIVKAMSTGIVDPAEPTFADTALPAVPLLNRTSGLKQMPNLRDLMRLKQTVAALYQSFFYINTTTADPVALERIAAGYPFSKAVAALNGFNKQIDIGFKVAVASSDTGQGKEKALHELMLLLRQAGGELLSAGKSLAPERDTFGPFQETMAFADGMTVPLLKEQLATLRGIAVRYKVMARPEWQSLQEMSPALDFGALTKRSESVLATIGILSDPFRLMEAHRAVSQMEELEAYKTLSLAREMLHEVEDALREITRRSLNQQQKFAQRDREDCEDAYTTLSETLEG